MSAHMGWIFLFLAGISEVGFVVFLKLSNGFTRLYPSLGFIMFIIFSFTFLTQSIKVIPLGTAYAIWTGIGALGSIVIGILFFQDPAGFWRIFFLSLITVGIVGLKIIS